MLEVLFFENLSLSLIFLYKINGEERLFSRVQEKKLPVGIDDFEKLIKWRFFYVDKTLMIKDLLSSCSKMNLFTRPRRFGKSLNISMLFQFFDIDSVKSVFEGLNILSQKELVSENMGKYLVILKLLKNGQ